MICFFWTCIGGIVLDMAYPSCRRRDDHTPMPGALIAVLLLLVAGSSIFMAVSTYPVWSDPLRDFQGEAEVEIAALKHSLESSSAAPPERVQEATTLLRFAENEYAHANRIDCLDGLKLATFLCAKEFATKGRNVLQNR